MISDLEVLEFIPYEKGFIRNINTIKRVVGIVNGKPNFKRTVVMDVNIPKGSGVKSYVGDYVSIAVNSMTRYDDIVTIVITTPLDSFPKSDVEKLRDRLLRFASDTRNSVDTEEKIVKTHQAITSLC